MIARYLRAKAKGRARLLKAGTGQFAIAFRRRDPDTDEELTEEIFEVRIDDLQARAKALADERRDILAVIGEMQAL